MAEAELPSAQPSSVAPDAGGAPAVPTEGEPWVLRLGNYLSKKPGDDTKAEGWAVSLGTYLKDQQPGPWSIIANEKPQDPLALRLGTFLNETKPIPVLHRDDDDEREPAKPIVLRLGNYLNGSAGACTAPTLPAANLVSARPRSHATSHAARIAGETSPEATALLSGADTSGALSPPPDSEASTAPTPPPPSAAAEQPLPAAVDGKPAAEPV